MKRFFSHCTTALFFICLLAVPMLSWILPDRQTSEIENRALQQFPQFSFRDLAQFTGELTDYVVDQFPARARLVKAFTQFEMMSGKWMVRNQYLVNKEWIFPVVKDTAQSQIDHVCTAIKEFCEEYPQTSFGYVLLPYKSTALSDSVPTYVDISPVVRTRQNILNALSSCTNLIVIDLSSDFSAFASEADRKSYYYQTDFHWNARGAAFITEKLFDELHGAGLLKGKSPRLHYEYELVDLQGKTYLGDLNRQLSYLMPMEEEISLIQPLSDFTGWRYYNHLGNGSMVARETIVGSGKQKDTINYNDIYTYNLGYYRVENDKALSQKSVLLLKDSFQNPTTDLFALQFRSVTIIDPRYYKEESSIDELLESEQPDIVLFLYNENNASVELAEFLAECS